MRAIIEEMITKDSFCIRSGNDGYSLIKDEIELNEAIHYLSAKAEAIAIRKNCLIRNFRQQVQLEIKDENQMELFQ